ncbi:MAG TPA: JAB domain-containing protein [Leptospiraceae bacterium]|nr:JAB domain-containing protein [Leptospiraceae bacterium]HMW07148.1 JAB domain-containing protein [Leptospiraceae bacterium]HMX31822.1 JAB domain-containing protein [Leptospiraceae bacterium]HMY32535.1 JAB domain-containing protein [Leptospiraceae bacterium]HMZ67010.1 JAB domain-containing protein [Leptospiraceae bacterium]
MIAVLLGSGGKGRNVEILSKELLIEFTGILGLVTAPISSLKKQKGLGKAKIATLVALKEIATRIKYKKLLTQDRFDLPSLLELLHLKALKEVRECFYLVTLSEEKTLINIDLLARGSLTEVGVYTRDIVKQILDDASKYVIIAHNHPNQSSQPSREDYLLFHRLRNLLSELEISLLDHLVIGIDGVHSCEENRKLVTIPS